MVGTWDIKDFKTRYEKNGEQLFEYSEMVAAHKPLWEKMAKSPLPNIPVVSRGWDTSARCRQDVPFPWGKNVVQNYPYVAFAKNNNADKFEALLRDAKNFAQNNPKKPRAVLINAWNEYTEGSCLLPDLRDSDESLRAIAAVFGRKPSSKYTFVDVATKQLLSIQAPTFENVPYGTHQKQKLDIWLPKNVNSKTPVAVYFHGGAWTNGGVDRIVGSAVETLLNKGIAVVAAKYRFIQDANDADIYPPVSATLSDAVNAVKFVKRNAEKWNIDTDKIALFGGSAGAVSAIYVGLSTDGESVAAIGAIIPQTSLDPKQMREWIPNINYGYHAFKCKSFDDWLQKREELMPFIKKYSPSSLLENCAKNTKIFLMYPRIESATEISKDATHSSKFGTQFKSICDRQKVPCTILKGSSPFTSMFEVVFESL